MKRPLLSAKTFALADGAANGFAWSCPVPMISNSATMVIGTKAIRWSIPLSIARAALAKAPAILFGSCWTPAAKLPTPQPPREFWRVEEISEADRLAPVRPADGSTPWSTYADGARLWFDQAFIGLLELGSYCYHAEWPARAGRHQSRCLVIATEALNTGYEDWGPILAVIAPLRDDAWAREVAQRCLP